MLGVGKHYLNCRKKELIKPLTTADLYPKELEYLHDPNYEKRLDNMYQKLEEVLIEKGLISLEDSCIEDDI